MNKIIENPFRSGDLVIANSDLPGQMLFSKPPDEHDVFYGSSVWNQSDKVLIVLSSASDKNYMTVLTFEGVIRWVRVVRINKFCMWVKIL